MNTYYNKTKSIINKQKTSFFENLKDNVTVTVLKF